MDYDQEMIRYRREFRRTKMSAVAQACPPDSASTDLSALAAEITRMAFLVWERLWVTSFDYQLQLPLREQSRVTEEISTSSAEKRCKEDVRVGNKRNSKARGIGSRSDILF